MSYSSSIKVNSRTPLGLSIEIKVDDKVKFYTLPKYSISKDKHIYIYDVLSSMSLLQDTAKVLSELVSKINLERNLNIDYIICAECKGALLGSFVADRLGIPTITFRKQLKSYYPMVGTKTKTYTSDESCLYLRKEDLKKMKGKSIIFVDDVFSTGKTYEAIQSVLADYDIRLKYGAFTFFEGTNYKQYEDIYSCEILPVD